MTDQPAEARPRGARTRRRRRRTRAGLALAIALTAIPVLALAAAFVAATVPAWPAARALLAIDIAAAPVPLALDGLVVAALVILLVRRWSRAALVSAAVGGAVLAIAMLALVAVANAQLWFGVQLDPGVWIWAGIVGLVTGLALGSLVRTGAARRLVAVATILAVLLAGAVGINGVFGLNRTLADLAGVTLSHPIALPHPVRDAPASPVPTPTGPLWQTWVAPAGMPAHGTTGQVSIPATVSGFAARPAGLYLPPAALVPHPPALPFVLMMMGQPGNPDPSFAAQVLDGYAARHHGLAPIVLVADQLGNPAHDTLCLDTARYGKVMTYLTNDVVTWARTSLHIEEDPADWVVAGYSNGGECAVSFGARDPDLWHNVLDISGEAYPGADRRAETLAQDFHGDRAAYQAQYPTTLLAQHHYDDMFAVFTVGSNDGVYRPQAQQMTGATQAAGWSSHYIEIPNGGHVLKALLGGLDQGFALLYPRLGLSQPGVAP